MLEDEKQPPDAPKEQAPEGADTTSEKEAEEHAQKHKRKAELRKLHDRDRAFLKESKQHSGRIFRRKSI
jgi:hypothetical protein